MPGLKCFSVVWANQFHSVAWGKAKCFFSFYLKLKKLLLNSAYIWYIFIIHLKILPGWRSSTSKPLLACLCCLTNSLAAQPASSFGGEQGCVLSLFIGELACPQRAGVLYLSHTASWGYGEASIFPCCLCLEDSLSLSILGFREDHLPNKINCIL